MLGFYVLMAILAPLIALGLLLVIAYSVYKQTYTVTISFDVGTLLTSIMAYGILLMLIERMLYYYPRY